jgi:hypothetical protein
MNAVETPYGDVRASSGLEAVEILLVRTDGKAAHGLAL